MKIVLDFPTDFNDNIHMDLKNIINKFRRKLQVADTTNYTDKMVEHMVSEYKANPTRATVDALANEFGKSVRSVIAKLSREGVYVAQQRQTKSGEPVVRKAELVTQLETHFEIQLPSLVKASKVDLEHLIKAVS